MNRLRLADFLNSRGPGLIGLCASDVAGCAEAVNAAQERLMTAREAGDTGWWGGWAEMAFDVDTTDPYLTAPRDVARIQRVNVCTFPVNIQNQFYEYLQFGSGNWPKTTCSTTLGAPLEVYSRGFFPTFTNIDSVGKTIRAYLSSTDDIGRRVLISGLDNNSQPLISTDDYTRNGLWLTLANPYADLMVSGAQVEVSKITALQKDVTVGPVSFYEVDLTTGAQVLLVTMQPSESVAAYPRYYFSGLPSDCCGIPVTTSGTIQVVALAKLDLIPCRCDTDYLLIQSKEALIAECESGFLQNVQTTDAKQQAAERHRAAIRLLQGQLVHFEGQDNPAFSFAPFGTADLSLLKVGQML